MAEDDTTTADAGDADANFGAGFSADAKPENPIQTPDTPETAATPRAEEPPEHVQISAKEWADVRAAALKTASYDAQLAKAFGTIGNLQKLVNEQRARATEQAPDKPAARAFKIDPESFAEMRRDFPELAAQTQAAIEKALSGLPAGANDADQAKIESLLAQYTAKREIEALEDAFPDWRQIVGAVNVRAGEQPDPENPFRKWLAGKDETYQDRINNSSSAAVMGRAIRTFQKETAAAAKPAATPQRDTARADRIRAAVQPRGDNAGAAPANTSEDAFAAGFGR